MYTPSHQLYNTIPVRYLSSGPYQHKLHLLIYAVPASRGVPCIHMVPCHTVLELVLQPLIQAIKITDSQNMLGFKKLYKMPGKSYCQWLCLLKEERHLRFNNKRNALKKLRK